ncbi:type-F conjugative transfer system protein TrbI [Salmonella enterica]|nr:type-F conjugative transfer system protein TrbI [Salmonella enterica]EIK2562347.1 type-F conjugative transfer system protein TrbI [Salmonella enterica]EKO2289575.1 type-F conjugative transfer system protein TrbI [Salmonella enterica]EKT6751939.1 type-F conjugative transfer system protein TrbI [Salmonella enterica]
MNTHIVNTTKPGKTSGPTGRHNRLWLALAGVALVAINAGISYGIVRLNTPEVVVFGMKQTVDAFFDSASQKKLSEAEAKILSERFNRAMEDSLQAWQRKHHALILVAPAVVQGAPDITRDIQQDIATRMRGTP